MKVEIRLKKLLQEKSLNRRGIIGQIAKELNLNRHTVAKIYNNQVPSISLDVLSKICTWLQKQGVSTSELPAALFSSSRTSLWHMIAKRETVTIYLGEYQQTVGPVAAWKWISRRDAAAAAYLVQQLSAHSEDGPPPPQLKFRYVPFRYALKNYDVEKPPLAEDIDKAGDIFTRMRSDTTQGASILIGSQRVNYLLEYFVADLFGRKPFSPAKPESKVPFYIVYRETDHKVPSCFGGLENPYRRTDASTPGLHFIGKKGTWVTCPWKEGRKDAGVIITLYNHNNKNVEIAVFGFSGRATDALGAQLLLKEHLFWPPPIEVKGKEVGIFICRLQLVVKQPSAGTEESILVKNCEVIPLTERTVKKFVR